MLNVINNAINDVLVVFLAVFHGSGGRLPVADVEHSTVNIIMDQCFKEIGIKKRDLNGQTAFGEKYGLLDYLQHYL